MTELPPLPEPFMELNRDIVPAVYAGWADQMLAFRAEGIAIAVAAEREVFEELAWELGGNRCDVLVDAIRARSKEQ
jgi:hypothetical protein